MASLYLQPRSQFYYIKYRKPDGDIGRFSTKLSRLNPVEVRRARQLEAEYTLRERSYGPSPAKGGGWVWVTDFLNTAYGAKPATRERFLGAWQSLERFLEERKIHGPPQFTRAHCFDYMTWRALPDKPNGKYAACHNTALLELKVLRILLTEAVVRELCVGNPCVKLKIHREAARRCPDLTNEQFDLIRNKISAVTDARLRAFYEITFEMGRWQGCRINATRVNPLTDILFEGDSGQIRFVTKGKEFVTLLHPRLIPLFRQLQAEGRTSTWDPPRHVKDKRTWPSLQWTNFFEHSGLKKQIPGVCYRSFRVTVATRMARKNVPLSKAKDFLKHASSTVHFVYQRLSPEDLGDCAKALE